MNNSKVFPYMAMHNKKALSGLVLLKTIQNNTEKQKKKEKCLEEGELDDRMT